MNADNIEVIALRCEGSLVGCSSDEEPGAETKLNPQIESTKQLVSTRSAGFMARHFPITIPGDWNNWKWQLRNSFKSTEALQRIMELTEDELYSLNNISNGLPIRVTPYFASLIYNSKPGDPLRRNVIPVLDELIRHNAEASDPLNEAKYSPVRGIVHRYPDRVLFTVTQFCSSYCRYCTRSHSVGKIDKINRRDWENAFTYIASNPAIRDVLISGGDPLTLSDEALDYILSRIRSIPHIQIIRIGSRVPAVLPQRITDSLIHTLRKYHPLFISLHFMHPDELTPECVAACAKLADGGFPLGSQTVLLKGINDSIDIMKDLMHKLLMARVKPYYLYQCDLISGSSHFRTSVRKGLDILMGLRGFTSGYAVPTFVIDAPGGGGKIPLLPNYVIEHTDERIVLRNYKGDEYVYPEIDSQQ